MFLQNLRTMLQLFQFHLWSKLKQPEQNNRISKTARSITSLAKKVKNHCFLIKHQSEKIWRFLWTNLSQLGNSEINLPLKKFIKAAKKILREKKARKEISLKLLETQYYPKLHSHLVKVLLITAEMLLTLGRVLNHHWDRTLSLKL